MTNIEDQRFFTESQVSKVLQTSVSTMRRWRLLRAGPPYVKVGGLVRYPAEDLREWLASRPGGGEAVGPRKEGAAR